MNEVIILAGGLGTRLRDAVPGLPKCMAPVNGKPFLTFVIEYFRSCNFSHFVFSLGYKSEVVVQFLNDKYPALKYSTVIEEEPLGTGGAIALSLSKCRADNVFITNGDTLFLANTSQLLSFHLANSAACTLALKPMQDFDRYGLVEINTRHQVISFREKKQYNRGLINGGLYVLNKKAFNEKALPDKFSFEKDFLEKFTAEGNFYGMNDEAYFIDIGIPSDFNKAQAELSTLKFINPE